MVGFSQLRSPGNSGLGLTTRNRPLEIQEELLACELVYWPGLRIPNAHSESYLVQLDRKNSVVRRIPGRDSVRRPDARGLFVPTGPEWRRCPGFEFD